MTLLTWILLGIDGFALIALLMLVIFLRYFLYSFLALTRPSDDANILVVEGWLAEQNLPGAIAEFDTGKYDYLITVGGPLRIGSYVSDYKTIAELTATTLVAFGFDPQRLIALPSPPASVNRTAATALTFRSWLTETDISVRGINIYSNHVHARRTYFLYQTCLPDDINIGVIASPAVAYDPSAWWKNSEGAKVLILELIAYCHTWIRHLGNRAKA